MVDIGCDGKGLSVLGLFCRPGAVMPQYCTTVVFGFFSFLFFTGMNFIQVTNGQAVKENYKRGK